jgi:hypothetical protein
MKVPPPRGPLSEALLGRLVGEQSELPAIPPLPADPLADDDFALALFCAQELHYGGLDGVSDDWEWRPEFVAFRSALEMAMLDRLLETVGPPAPCEAEAVPEAIFALIEADEATQFSRFLATRASLEQFREFAIHRSAYQLKEADPHTFAIPRIAWPAKSAMVEIQADEYGGGDPERMHSRLFARAMKALGLDTAYGHYVELLPASTLTTVNLISLFGLRRRWRGALAGHLAAFEITSPQPNRRYANGLRRLGLGPDATEFFDEHVEADSVHENIAAYDLAGGLARQEPQLAGDILFGVRALLHCEARFADHILGAWESNCSSLLSAQPAPAATVAA